MEEKYIYYDFNGKRYKISESDSAEFEKDAPNAKINISVNGKNYNIGVKDKEEFLKDASGFGWSYTDFDNDLPQSKPTHNIPDTAPEKKDRTTVFETIGKGLGAAGVGTAKLALDLGQNLWQQTLGRLDDQTLDEVIHDESNPVTRASMRLGEIQERLSREADPTGGEVGFGQLLKEGKIGMAAQKALGSGLESLPMMVAAGTGWGALLYGTAMAAGQYADETRENDDIPAWKRGVNAIGSAALEMAVEKIGGPLKNIGGKAGKEFSEEMAKEIMEEFAKEGTEKVAKRIFNTLKKPLKEGLEEGGEEVLTSFGNDTLGSALDLIDGDKDYGIHAQWEQMKEQDPEADLGDFAKQKASEYFDAFLGGALSGMEIAGTTDAIRLGVSKSQKNQIVESRNLGSTLGLQDMYDVDHQLINSGNEVEKAFTGKDGKPMFSRDFIDGLGAEEAYELSRNEDMTPYQRKALLWHAKSKAIQEGLIEKMDAELDGRIKALNQHIDEAQENGSVVTGFYNGQPVYVKGGIPSSGSVTLPNGENGPVVVINQMTGEKATVRTEDIKMPDSIAADEYRARIEAQLRNNDTQNREMWRNNMSKSAKTKEILQYLNTKITINGSNGLTQVEVISIDPENGRVLIKGKKGDLGQSELQIEPDLFYDSIARNEDGTPVFVEKLPQKEQVTETPVAEPTPQPEAPVAPAEPQDFREYTGTIMLNGVPVNVIGINGQDDTADRVDFTYVDSNGVQRAGSTTVAGFAQAVQEAKNMQPETPVIETPTENVTPKPAPEVPPTTTEIPPQSDNTPIPTQSINWDALLESDPEAYFTEMQNRFGDRTGKKIDAVISFLQSRIDTLNKAKAKTESIGDVLDIDDQIDALQSKIDILNGMAARLAAPAPEVAPTTPAAPAQPSTPAPAQPAVPQQPTDNVPDVSVDKAADARARGFRMTNGQRVDRRGETTGAYGKETDVTFTADSKGKRTGKVKVIDAGSLVPSHIRGVENVEHFLPEAQPKKRTDAASTVSATLIAQNMDSPKMTNVASSAYEGAPIVNRRGEVIQGNNRSAAILEMYQSYPEKSAEYKQYIIDHAADFGLNAEEVAAMQNPVLVRELDVDDTDAITLGQYTMQDMESGGNQMIDSNRAIAGLNNKGLMADFISILLAEENEETSDMNLSDLITRNGNEALKLLSQNGIINQTQYQSALGANGRITADARAALRGIIEQQLFAGGIDNLSVMFEVLPDKAKKAIMQTISRDLKNPDDAKVTPYLQEAIEVYYQLNQQPDFVAAKTKEEVDNAVELFKGQTSLEEAGTPAEKYSNFAFDLAKKFKTLTLKQQRELLNQLYDTIAGVANIFGESEGKPLGEAVAEIYGTNLNKGNNETNGQSGAAVLEGGNGGSQEGQQGSTGNVGVRPETGESGQGTTNGGANPTVGGGTQTTGEVTPVAPNPVANPADAAKAKERRLKNIIARYDLTPEHKYDLAVQIGKEIGDFFATIEEYESFEENATDFGAEYNKAVREGVDKSFAERQQNTGNSQENGVTLETEPKQGEDGTETGTETPEGTEGYNGTTGGQHTDDEGGKEGTQETEGLRGGDVNQEIKYPAREGDATRQLLMDTFGFASVSPGVSQENLNHIYDFLMEMSKMLGISPTSISHGATLGMGVLGEGRIGTLASYQYRASWDGTIKEPYLRFKNSLLSSIAHEWWHSLDQALSYYETGRGKKPSTTASADEFTGRPEVLEAVRDILKAINKSGHKARLDSELKYNPEHLSYSKRKKELAARFFEGYIKSKFAEAGIVVNGFSTTQENTPTEEEVKPVIPAFDRLFKVLKEKEGKKEGSTVLYHIGQEVDKIENEKRVSEEASQLATETALTLLKDNNLAAEIASDEKAQEVYDALSELSGVEMMTAYHGSGAKFEQFDHSHMGEGEGAQALGWGTYVALNKATSEGYASRMGGGNRVLLNGDDVTDVARALKYDPYSPASFLVSLIKMYGDIDKARNHIEESIKEEQEYKEYFAGSKEHESSYYSAVSELEKLEKALELLNENTWTVEERKAQLYTVEIPEDNGSNYLSENGQMSEGEVERLIDACEREGLNVLDVLIPEIDDKRGEGRIIYTNLTRILGSDKAASEFLSKAGFVGIKYNGRTDGECCVIFNADDAKITNHIEFYQTPKGTIYGWTDGKNIYLTKAGINPNTPIHEYTHLWAKAMMQKNPKGWNSIKQLLKKTPIWNQVVNDSNYSNIKNNEDSVASEVISRLSGTKNAAKLEQMAQQMIDEAKGTMRKVEARGLIQNIKDALNKFWSWVGKNLFEIENFNSIDEITDRVLYDLVNKTDLQLDTLSESQVEAQIVTDPKVIAELEASPKTKGFRNVVQNEDGTFSSPMAYWLQSTTEGAKSRIETAKFELGKWEEAEEHPELVDESGHVTLVKPNKKTVSPVAYDPYIHNRLEPVNLQFKEAWNRSDLVYVETEVADTDLESGYHADKAKLPVGVHSWSNGAVMLSKYDKPVRVMPWDEVADAWAERLNGKGVEFDVVPAEMRSLLVERGVEILPPHKNAGKDCNDAYQAWKAENKKIAINRNAEPSQSDIPSGDVDSNIKGAPTVISPRQSESDAKVLNRTQKAKKHLKDFINGDLNIGEIKSLSDVMQKLHDYLGMGYRGRGMYATYNTPNGTVDFRVNDHNAYGGNFEKVGADNNISVYVEYFSFKYPESKVPYFEFKYSPEDFEAHTEEIFKEILEAVDMLLNDGFFPSKLTYAEMTPHNIDNIDESILFRRSDIQNSVVDYLVGDPRLNAIENAVNDEAAKIGVKVTYKTREEMPAGHKNDKGYYNTTTGEIVICTENASSIADAIQTILHEAVAHKGLRQLMGDKFNEFINRVYNSLDAETKAKVDAIAAEQHDGNIAVAMEEYMASLAETENFAENSVWDTIKSIFEKVINAILGRNDIKIGDNELRYILRASYYNMTNPRNMETIRGWAQDQMMREEYKINETNTPELLSRTGIDPTQISRETAAQTYNRVVSQQLQEFQRQFQDAFQPVRIAIDAIQQETGNIPIEDYENYLLIQNQMSSRSRVEIDKFARRYYTPIIKQVNAIINKIMDMRGLNKRDKAARAEVNKEVRQYLIAKHGLERNKYYQEHKTRTMTAKEMKPLLDEAEKDYQTEVNMINMNNNLTDAERELQLRDALDVYNATVQEIKTREVPYLRDYSGLTSLFGLDGKEWEKAEEKAHELVDDFENSLGRENNEDGEIITQSKEIDALWKRINAATDKTLRHSYESGMLSRQQYNEIKEMFKFYIPLRGFDETTAEDVYSYARFEGNRFNAAVHKAEGRTSVADDPLAIIMNMAESEIAQGNKNRAKQALYNYLLNRAGAMNEQNSLMQLEDVWYLIDVDEDGNKTYQIVTPDHASGETYEEFENKMQALAEEGRAEKSRKGKLDIGYRFQKQDNRNAHYVFVKINGVEKAIYINGDPKAADAINGRYQKELGAGIKFFRDIQRVISSTFTNYSLEFTARNYFRDMIYSHINIGVRESDPAYRKKFRQNWRHNNMGTMMKMLKAYRAGEYDGRALTEDEAAFVEFMENGGQTGYTLINSVENHKKDLQRAIERMQSGIEKGGVKDSTIFKATLGSIELLNEASELVTRFAAYKTSRDMGRGINSSIKDAKEVTVNFNTKGAQDGQGWMGAVARYFGWSKFFFNASVQGVQNLKSMRDANKLKFGTVVGGVVATGFFMPILVSVVSELLGGDDEEEYWNIPEYERQNNFCIPLGNGKYAKVPLPIGFREVYAIGDMVAASLMDKRFNRNAGEVGMDIANKIASIVLPVNPLESMSTGLNMWQTFLYTGLPSSAQVLIQNATNTDWKGTPLQKEYTYNENDPKWMKAFASNPDWMKGLSKWCNEHINLDGDYKGMDWSPEKLENTLSNLGGGIYSLIKKSGKTLSMIWNEENRSLSNVPLAGVVLGSGVDSDDRFVTDAYFDMKDFYDANLNYIKRRAEQFGYDLEDVFLKEKGKHQPKMLDIYQNRNFDFMQEWYKGNKELEEMNREIKKLKKEIAAKEKPSTALLNKLAKKQDKFNAERRDFVNDMLELD